MQAPSHNFIKSLLNLAQAGGGQMIAVVGDAKASGDYWVGARYEPVKTLFEATLRCLLAGSYERVVAFTGLGREHLPPWNINQGFRLGDEEMIWCVRGAKNQAPATVQPNRKRNDWEDVDPGLAQYTTAPIDRLLWRSNGSSYWDRLENYVKYRDEEKARPNRCALVVDYNFLTPNKHEASQHTSLAPDKISERRINGISARFRTSVEGTRTDLAIFSEDELVHDLLQEPKRGDPSIILGAVARHFHQDQWAHIKPGLENRLPQLHLSSQIPTVAALRTTGPLRGPRLIAHASTRHKRLYDQLCDSTLNRRPSIPTPPVNPEVVALEFWADLDLTPLKKAFDDEIIGQAQAKETILGILEHQKRNCARLLEHDGRARKTVKDQTFILPAVGLFGAAGMGKTTFCNVIVDHLFGDKRFGRVIDLAGKNIKVATIGVEPPMVGCDDESDLMAFAKQSGGLGVACFDEFTRLSLITGGHNNTLATELGPLLQLLQERKFEPANPKHRPQGRFYYFANTLFIFSGNISRQGEATQSGFRSIEDLGPAFGQRVSRQVYFTPLNDEDYRVAADRSLRRYARDWASNFKPSAVPLAENETAVEQGLIDAVEERLKFVTSQSAETASIRRLNRLVDELNYERAFEEAETSGSNRLTLGTSLIPREWQV
jgi:hypothetical protein